VHTTNLEISSNALAPADPGVKLLTRLAALAGLVLVMLALRSFCDRAGIHAPWYLIHELVLMGLPMAWLLFDVYPKLSNGSKLAFIATSATFIGSSAIAELIAIGGRYWWFYTKLDPLSGVELGGVPIEEFLSYPMLLNLPVLFYLWLGTQFGAEKPVAFPTGTQRGLKLAALAAAGFAGYCLYRALTVHAPALDLSAQPFADAAGAIRYSAGPKQLGWTLVQAFGWAGTLLLLSKAHAQTALRRLAFVAAIYFVYSLFIELLACGRGWWVWNSEQTLGLFALVLPVESFSMYLTGALMPVLFFELIRPAFSPHG
jgi:hypothetical protein